MGYLFLTIALLSGTAKGFCGKKTSQQVQGYKDALFTNSIRMVLCIFIGFAMIVSKGDISVLKIDVKTMFITTWSGITTSGFVVLWLLAVRKGAYMMMDVFLTMGVLIPTVLSKIFFDEAIKLNQWCGMGILLVAAVIMCSYNNQIKEKLNVKSVIILILCGAANGLTDFSQKMFVKTTTGDVAVFNFYTYVFSAIVLFTVYFIETGKKRAKKRQNTNLLKKTGGYVAVMAVCLFAYSYFKTLAALYLPSVILYPLSQGAGLILSLFMSAIFFKEKLTVKCIVGIVIAFTGLLILNM